MLKKIFTIFVYTFACIGLFLTAGYVIVRFGFSNTSGIIDLQREKFLNGVQSQIATTTNQTYDWQTIAEWQTLKNAIQKDQGVINRASATAGIPARLIVSQLIAEQLRFYTSDRSSYEQFFAPLKILGSETQFSWGVMGIKEDTAVQIENNLKNQTSPFYLGLEYEHLLDFQTTDINQERFTRLTDQHDHYYGYLYAGLYVHEVETQWKNAGFDISNRPDIIATLYNIGFSNSKPNRTPQSGGAEIQIGGKMYSFGSLASEFYNSNELLDEFPRN